MEQCILPLIGMSCLSIDWFCCRWIVFLFFYFQADLAANVQSIRSIPQTEKISFDSQQYETEADRCLMVFKNWEEHQQVDFATKLLSKMCHYQHGQINSYLKPMLQRDFITALPGTLCRLC